MGNCHETSASLFSLCQLTVRSPATNRRTGAKEWVSKHKGRAYSRGKTRGKSNLKGEASGASSSYGSPLLTPDCHCKLTVPLSLLTTFFCLCLHVVLPMSSPSSDEDSGVMKVTTLNKQQPVRRRWT